MSSVRESLIAAKARIADPKRWTKAGGDGVETFCAAVACNDFAHDAPGIFGALVDALPSRFRDHPSIGVTKVFWFNDHPDTTHADIMALFDRAIAAQAQP